MRELGSGLVNRSTTYALVVCITVISAVAFTSKSSANDHLSVNGSLNDLEGVYFDPDSDLGSKVCELNSLVSDMATTVVGGRYSLGLRVCEITNPGDFSKLDSMWQLTGKCSADGQPNSSNFHLKLNSDQLQVSKDDSARVLQRCPNSQEIFNKFKGYRWEADKAPFNRAINPQLPMPMVQPLGAGGLILGATNYAHPEIQSIGLYCTGDDVGGWASIFMQTHPTVRDEGKTAVIDRDGRKFPTRPDPKVSMLCPKCFKTFEDLWLTMVAGTTVTIVPELFVVPSANIEGPLGSEVTCTDYGVAGEFFIRQWRQRR